jgi:hypothetical protein
MFDIPASIRDVGESAVGDGAWHGGRRADPGRMTAAVGRRPGLRPGRWQCGDCFTPNIPILEHCQALVPFVGDAR